ncbi:MAG: hypothetical protein WCP86_03740, partial [bacterium]
VELAAQDCIVVAEYKVVHVGIDGLQDLCWIWAVAYRVAKAYDLVDAEAAYVQQDGIPCLQVRMYVG